MADAKKEVIVHVNGNDEWKEVMENDKSPAIVDFYADWCGPCKKLGEYIKNKVKDASGWRIVKIDVDKDENADISQNHDISGIPAVFLYIDGKKSENFVGYNEAKINEFIEKATKSANN